VSGEQVAGYSGGGRGEGAGRNAQCSDVVYALHGQTRSSKLKKPRGLLSSNTTKCNALHWGLAIRCASASASPRTGGGLDRNPAHKDWPLVFDVLSEGLFMWYVGLDVRLMRRRPVLGVLRCALMWGHGVWCARRAICRNWVNGKNVSFEEQFVWREIYFSHRQTTFTA
jgi:hypothetical protein